MRKSFIAACAAIALASVAAFYADKQISAAPATPAAFPDPTNIYYAVGVFDSGGPPMEGTATAVSCSNLSTADTTVKWLVYNENGGLVGHTTRTLGGRRSHTVATRRVYLLGAEGLGTSAILDGGFFFVQATRSEVFCSAMIIDAKSPTISGIDLHMVRLNAHPGTVE
jgi:hypothetical protein